MIGLGTIINTAAIVHGGIISPFAGKRFKPEQRASINKACGAFGDWSDPSTVEFLIV